MLERESIYHKLPFYYGWAVFLVTFLTFTLMYGLRYSIGVFFVPLQKEFGWSSAMTAGTVTVFFWVYGFSSIFVGQLYERLGVRKVILLGGLLLGVGGILSSSTLNLWQLYFSWGVVAATGSSILYVVPNMILARFFVRHRGKAVGWASTGISVGQAVLVPFAAWVIVTFGWRLSYVILSSFVILGISFFGFLVFRESPESIGLRPDGNKLEQIGGEEKVKEINESREEWTTREVLSNISFRLILLSYFFAVGSIISLMTFVVPHIISLGIDPLLAATAFGIIGIMSALGSLVFGFVSDWVGRKSTIIILAAGLSISMLSSAVIPPDLILLYLWVSFYGLSYGGIPEQYAAIVADYFPSRKDVALFGYVTAAGAFGGGLFPLIGGFLADQTGNYYASLTFLGVGMTIAFMVLLFLKPPQKMEQI